MSWEERLFEDILGLMKTTAARISDLTELANQSAEIQGNLLKHIKVLEKTVETQGINIAKIFAEIGYEI